ncbi:hypothetical protein [Streptomyces ficellus]|uniref:Uncharacterized protein n=1 Tax=Streptomyces ficellus TaxID=1977088 RepID=A0A6I6FAT9_9ACTN|nr:hypothetical protein [Streptomyces ficellus]QGV77302.1 hypothetical protein EIZ62_02800 [Streptomyces ficellus]
MRNRNAFAGVAAMAALTVLATQGAASASARPGDETAGTARTATQQATQHATQQAVQHAMNGTLRTADLDVIKGDPVLARTVPVSVKIGAAVYSKAKPPSRTKAAGAGPAVAGRAGQAAFQQVCTNVNLPLTATSYLGTTLYTWHHTFSWCTANQVSGVEATRVITASPYSRSDYFSAKSSVAYPQGLVTDTTFAPVGGFIGLNTTGAGSPYYSHMARSVNLCIAQYSCYASNLPQSKLTLGRDTASVALSNPL